MERVKGIEPSTSAWKAGVLPLNYTRTLHMYMINVTTETIIRQIAPYCQHLYKIILN